MKTNDEKLSTQQRQMLIELDGIAEQIRKGHHLNVHFRAFQLANTSWQEHIRQNALSGARGRGVDGAVLGEPEPAEDVR